MYDHTSLLLNQIEGPVNLGFICRAMANTGFSRLYYTGDLSGDEDGSRRFAVHASEILQNAQKLDSFSALIKGQDVVFGFTPRQPWQDGRSLDMDGFHANFSKVLAEGKRIGLLFGNEQRGLENNHLARCHFRVSLPTSENYVSMNLAQAVLVVLWELRRSSNIPSPLQEGAPETATAEEQQALLDNIHRFLETIGFLNPQNPEQLWREVQPLFATRDWNKRELTLLHAIFGKARSRYLASLRNNVLPESKAPDNSK